MLNIKKPKTKTGDYEISYFESVFQKLNNQVTLK